MGLSTHVLDTASGRPAAGMQVTLERTTGGRIETLGIYTLNAAGRNDAPLIEPEQLVPGTYRLAFAVAAYFRVQGVELPEPPFLDIVNLDFGIASPEEHYHVPLLVSPWSYSTYRGS
ncbi:hydroxyisourate hydrolase [Verticiella sediminum]|uniref:5-hydroxyisourate hydrolase n=1 Tax=Verticiella sediminum TaxID=1247510 RepID=A0A556AYS9_9BURK|nr:hydroxyisourate hydrolase [Verticiella sediminum]TSH98078.1 hydroxyisourate hydrolase [Verticiella sediminum]